MRTIVINGISLCLAHSGIQRYMVECLLEVDKLIQNKELKIEMVYPMRMTITCPHFQNIKVKPLFGMTRYWYKYTLPLYIKNKRAVYVGMGNDEPMGDTNVVCLHDLIPIKPEAQSTQEVFDRNIELYAKIASKCALIVTVSDYSKKDIIEQLKVPEGRVIVIPCAWQHIKKIGFDDTVFEKYKSLQKEEYYYTIGNILPHKNLRWIVETAKNNPDCIFAIAGSMPASGNRDELKLDNVIYLGRVTDEENKSLMKHCKAFIHPSFLEGFGIPPMEALYLGKPIIISNTSCLPEIYGGSAHYIDPYRYDYDLDLLLTEKVEESETVLDKYSWEKTGKLWYDLFQNISKN